MDAVTVLSDVTLNADLKMRLEALQQEKSYLRGITLDSPREDVTTLYLRGKELEIERLSKDITAYENPEGHFTKKYRALEGHCVKVETDLDGIDLAGRDDLRSLRKGMLLEIQNLTQLLTEKVHSSGKICPNCEGSG